MDGFCWVKPFAAVQAMPIFAEQFGKPAVIGVGVALQQQDAQRVGRRAGLVGQFVQPMRQLGMALGGVVHHDQRGALPAPGAEVLLLAKALQLAAADKTGVPALCGSLFAQFQRQPGFAGAARGNDHPPAQRRCGVQPGMQAGQLAVAAQQGGKAAIGGELLDVEARLAAGLVAGQGQVGAAQLDADMVALGLDDQIMVAVDLAYL